MVKFSVYLIRNVFVMLIESPVINATCNSVSYKQKLRSSASELGLLCLPVTLLKITRLKWLSTFLVLRGQGCVQKYKLLATFCLGSLLLSALVIRYRDSGQNVVISVLLNTALDPSRFSAVLYKMYKGDKYCDVLFILLYAKPLLKMGLL